MIPFGAKFPVGTQFMKDGQAMTFTEWWQFTENWRTEGGSGQMKAAAAWDHQQKIIDALMAALSGFEKDGDDAPQC